MLLYTSPGRDVKFYAIIPVGVQYRLASFTPASCLRCTSDGRDSKALNRALTAASVLQACIIRYTERYLSPLPPTIPDGAHRLPGCKDTAHPTRITTSNSKYSIFMSNRDTACSTSPRPVTGVERRPSSSSRARVLDRAVCALRYTWPCAEHPCV